MGTPTGQASRRHWGQTPDGNPVHLYTLSLPGGMQATLSDLGATVPTPRGSEEVSVRDVLVHMVDEYARHCGHADLLRECIDGRTGQ